MLVRLKNYIVQTWQSIRRTAMRPILSESHEQEFSTTTQQHMQTLVLGRVPSTTTVRTMLTRSSIPPVQEYSTATRNRPSISQEQECSTTIQDTMLTRPSISYEQEHYKTPDSAQPMHDSITAVFTTSTRPSISYEQALPKTPDPAEAQERSTTAVFTMPTRPSIRPDSVIIPAPHKHDIRSVTLPEAGTSYDQFPYHTQGESIHITEDTDSETVV